MIINLTGQAGAGKTVIAKELLKLIPNSINLDGDELRELFVNKDYSENGRRNNITNAYNIAIFLESKGFVPILSLISPYLDLREDLKKNRNAYEFYIFTNNIRGREHYFAKDYVEPQENYIKIVTDDVDESHCAKLITSNITLLKNLY